MVSAAPVIGISTYREPARFGVWDERADLVPTSYSEAVRQAGGIPVLLPPNEPWDASARAVVARLDGLVVAGGADISAAEYGAAPHARAGTARTDRDGWERALLDAALTQRQPTLGVCRGMQLMAVHAGGTLHQHVPDVVGHEDHDPGGNAYGATRVAVDTRTVLGRLLGAEAVVHCHHHQAVRTHPGFAAAAWAADGTVEAFVRTDGAGHPFSLGVQWHPEVVADLGLFRGLVEAAGRGPGPLPLR